MNIKYRALHWCHEKFLTPHGRRFEQIMLNPKIQQNSIFRSIIQKNTATQYGRQHRFDSIDDVNSFRQQVPISTYKDYESYIDTIRIGKKEQLTSEEVTFFEPTSGSSGVRKLIPYTQSLLKSFNAATKPWLFNLSRNYPRAFRGRHYWSISPAHEQATYQSVIPIGMSDDSEYFDFLSRFYINQIMAVPSSVRHLKSEDEWRYRTALNLLACDNLSLISVWSPTFLTVLFEYIQQEFSPLVRGLNRARRNKILTKTSEYEFNVESIWPELGLVSCWADGVSERFVEPLRAMLPSTPIQGKGLLTTECVISIPWQTFPSDKLSISNGHVLAVDSHFLEFIPMSNASSNTRLAHELVIGEQYVPVVTTQGGLYRYQLQDLVECIGYESNTPRIKFIGKQDHMSDLAGEKLHSGLIEFAMREATLQTGVKPAFAMIAPPENIPGSYCVFIESNEPTKSLDSWVELVEKNLKESHHYEYAQRLTQLKPLVWRRVDRAWQSYQTKKQQGGMKLGDIKPTVLDTKENWHTIFNSSMNSKFSAVS
ncbi:MAG: GH3 auxin-responsive promoter family protein [Gammaproteobacteria bacterium]|nr:GH3 auxin-responsive promoter family protein [Gammaproteobacteria bacterium]